MDKKKEKIQRIKTHEFRKGAKWEEHEKVAVIKHLIEDVLQYSFKDIEENICYKTFQQYGLESILKTYPKDQRNPYILIQKIYPEHTFEFQKERRLGYIYRKKHGDEVLKCECCGIGMEDARIYDSDLLGNKLCKKCYNSIWGLHSRRNNSVIIKGDDQHICKVCGEYFNNVITHVYQIHHLNKQQYIDKYNINHEVLLYSVEDAKKEIFKRQKQRENFDTQIQMEIEMEEEIKIDKSKIIEKITTKSLKEKVNDYNLEPFKNLIKTRNVDFLNKFAPMLQEEINKGVSVEENLCKIELIYKEINRRMKKER